MNRWSANSSSQLASCHEELQLLFGIVLQIYDCSILKGFRGNHEQHQAFLSGASQLDWPDGKHNGMPSMAVDAKPYISEINVDGRNPKHLKYFYAFAYVVIAVAAMLYEAGRMTHKIRWGGDWDSDRNMDDQGLIDLYHFELVVSSSS